MARTKKQMLARKYEIQQEIPLKESFKKKNVSTANVQANKLLKKADSERISFSTLADNKVQPLHSLQEGQLNLFLFIYTNSTSSI